MFKSRNFLITFTLTLLLFFVIKTETAYAVNIYGPAPHFVAENIVDITTPIYGDSLLIGETITITKPVEGDMFLIGDRVLIDAPINGDVRVIANRIDIKSRISGSFGFISEQTFIQSTGEIDRDAYGISSEVTHNGRIGGNLNVLQPQNAETIIGGKVIGNVHYAFDKPNILQDAFVGGEVTKTNIQDFQPSENEIRLQLILGKIYHSLSLILIAFLLWKFLNKQYLKSLTTYKSNLLTLIPHGLAGILIIPLVILFLFVTVIGIPIALTLLGLFLLAIYLSPIFLSTLIGNKIFSNNKLSFLHIAIGILIYDVASLGPGIGFILGLLSLLTFIGLITRFVLNLRKQNLVKKK